MVMTKEYPDNHNYIIYSDGWTNVTGIVTLQPLAKAEEITPTVFVGNM